MMIQKQKRLSEESNAQCSVNSYGKQVDCSLRSGAVEGHSKELQNVSSTLCPLNLTGGMSANGFCDGRLLLPVSWMARTGLSMFHDHSIAPGC